MIPATPTFEPARSLIGMIHVAAMPGTPTGELSVDQIVDRAAEEAKKLTDAGFDALLIENLHDRPYLPGERLGPETVAVMTRVGLAVRQASGLPLGVQILSCGNKQALAVAHAVGGSFIRCENFVFAHVADEGLLATAEAPDLLRYRKLIGAEHVRIYADVKKKHASHAITDDIDIKQVAQGAEFFRADGLVVTGAATGEPTHPEDVAYVKDHVDCPVFVGSGATADSVPDLLEHADALIVGSFIKENGYMDNPVDPARCEQIVRAVREFRGG